MHVLVVEDEPLIRLLATDILEMAGFRVSEACTAAAARAAVRARPFDAAVVDLGLPDSTGDAIVRDLLAAQPGLGLVISTGRQLDDPMVLAVRHAGGHRIAGILGKPWADAALIAAVRRAGGACRAPSPCLAASASL